MKIRIKIRALVGTFYSIRKYLIFLMLLLTTVLHSQSFSEENTSLYIGEGVAIFVKEKDSSIVLKERCLEPEKNIEKGIVYVSKDTHIHGFNYFKNFKLSKTKTTQYTTTHTLEKRKQSTHKSETKKKPTAFIKTYGYKHAFGMLTGTSENAVLKNTNNTKRNFLQKNKLYLYLSFTDNVKVTFSIYSFFLTKGKTKSFYTRPPPSYNILLYL